MKKEFEEKALAVNNKASEISSKSTGLFRKIKVVAATFLIAITVSPLTACFGNQNIWDGMTNESNTFTYAVICENGIDVLYEIDKWMDSSSDAMGFVEKETGQTIWSSYNKGQFYRSKPEERNYNYTAAELRAMSKEEIDAIKAEATCSHGIVK